MSKIRRFTISVFFFALVCGCGSSQKKASSSAEAEFSALDSSVFQKLEQHLSNHYLTIEEPRVLNYLNGVLEQLFVKKNEPAQSSVQPPKVVLVSSERGSLGVRTWVVPPQKIIVDVRTLRALKFENEIAALLSFHYERTLLKSFREKLKLLTGTEDKINLEEFFSWNETEDFQAIEAAIDRLYYSNYDPRALVSVFSKLEAAGFKNDFKTPLESLKSKTTRALSFYPPLINPIVQTDEFYRVKKIMERL